MKSGTRILLLALCITALAYADTFLPITLIQLSSPITNGVTDRFSFSTSYDQHFTLTVTGGTGDAYFTPWLVVQGENTDTSPGNQTVTVQAALTADNNRNPGGAGLYAPDNGNPSATCYGGFYNPCRTPFTFGVPEDIHLTATAYIAYACQDPRFENCPAASGTLTASAALINIGDFAQYFPGVAPPVELSNVNFTFTPAATTPEPGTLPLVFSAGMGISFWIRKRSAKLRKAPQVGEMCVQVTLPSTKNIRED